MPIHGNKRDPALLAWWHPHRLLREIWNIGFSLALGAALSGIAIEILAQILGKISSIGWQDWSERLTYLRWAVGCFVAYVSYISYRMDDRND